MDAVVGSLLALAGVVVGALVDHFLSRGRSERQLSLEERKVWAGKRFDVYTRFRAIASELHPGEGLTDEDRDRFEVELLQLTYEIQLIGHRDVVKAADELVDAFKVRSQDGIPLAYELRAVTNAVRNYIDATRSALGMDALLYDQ